MDVRLANDLSQMEAVLARLDAFAQESAMPPNAAHRLRLAVDELVNNAIDHGYPDGRTGEISICVHHHGDHVELTLSDDGDPFDPFSAPTPDLAASVEERRIGGLGVHLVRTMAQGFAYRREDGRNVVTLSLTLA